MHGLNENRVEFHSHSMVEIRQMATSFGFFCVDSFTIDSLSELRLKASEGQKTGTYNGKPVEGFVIRCKDSTCKDPKKPYFFKIKFDEPYLVFCINIF